MSARRIVPQAAAVLAAAALAACAAPAGTAPMHAHAAAPAADAREAVRFPPMLREHTLANMREHLATLAAIQSALSEGGYDRASTLAETRLGLSSLEAHGAHEVAPYMPPGMQALGMAMHRAASRFAIAATNAGATGDVRPALDALSGLTAQCVACHGAYRLQ